MLSKNQLGFLYMFMSICAFSLMDVLVKWSVDYPIGQVLFFRGFFGIIFYFFIIPKERLHNFYQTKRPGLHMLRCTSGLNNHHSSSSHAFSIQPTMTEIQLPNPLPPLSSPSRPVSDRDPKTDRSKPRPK